ALATRRKWPDLVAGAFTTLETVAQGDYSKWNIVYDPVALKVWFRSRGSWQTKNVSLRAFDPSCSTRVKMLDMKTVLTGDVSRKFEDYDEATNRRIVAESLKPIAGQLPPGAIDLIAHYPDMLSCTPEVVRSRR